jgi:hypothetical protein
MVEDMSSVTLRSPAATAVPAADAARSRVVAGRAALVRWPVDAARTPAAAGRATPSLLTFDAGRTPMAGRAWLSRLPFDAGRTPTAGRASLLTFDAAPVPAALLRLPFDAARVRLAAGRAALLRQPVTGGAPGAVATHSLPSPSCTGRSPPAEPFHPRNDRRAKPYSFGPFSFPHLLRGRP